MKETKIREGLQKKLTNKNVKQFTIWLINHEKWLAFSALISYIGLKQPRGEFSISFWPFGRDLKICSKKFSDFDTKFGLPDAMEVRFLDFARKFCLAVLARFGQFLKI